MPQNSASDRDERSDAEQHEERSNRHSHDTENGTGSSSSNEFQDEFGVDPKSPVGVLIRSLLLVTDVSPCSEGWEACCPVHMDSKASLTIGEGEDGRALLNCHAGCDTRSILKTIGLTMQDLFPEHMQFGRKENEEHQEEMDDLEAIYPYHDEDGLLLYEVVRKPGKKFSQRRPDGNGGYVWNINGVRRILWHLPHLVHKTKPDQLIFVTEGERDAETLIRNKRFATTKAGGAKTPWLPEFNKHLVNKRVVVLADNDDVGKACAAGVVKSLAAAGGKVTFLLLPDLSDKGDVTDWFEAGGTAEELVKLAEEALARGPFGAEGQADPDAWDEPMPLDAGDLPAFPVSVLPDWMGNMVEAVAESTQTPTDLAGMIGLSILGLAFQRKFESQVRPDWVETLSVWTNTALPPANLKSPVFRKMIEPINEYQRDEAKRLEKEIEIARNKYEILNAKLRKTRKKAVDATDEADKEDMTAKAEELALELSSMRIPVFPRLISDDATPEKIAMLMAERDERIAIMSPEGNVFEMMSGQYNGGTPNLTLYLKGHCGDSFASDRVSRDSVYLYRPAITMGITVQPQVLISVGGKVELRGRGLFARFFYAVPTSPLGKRRTLGDDNPPSSIPHQESWEYEKNVKTILGLPAKRDDKKGHIKAMRIQWTEEALKILGQFQKEIEPRLGSGGDLEDLNDWGGKLIGGTIRVATLRCLGRLIPDVVSLKQLTDWLGLPHEVRNVRVEKEDVEAAIEFAGYLIPHAKHAFGLMGCDPALEGARRIIAWIKKKRISDFSQREAHRALEHYPEFCQARNLEIPLNILVERDWLRPVSDETRVVTGRPPSPRFLVNPRILEEEEE